MTKSTPPKLVRELNAARSLQSLADVVANVRALSVHGLWGSSLAAVTSAIEKRLNRPVLVICGHVDEADDIADDMELFHGRRPDVLSHLEMGSSLGRFSEEQVANRMNLLASMAAGTKQGDPPRLVVSPIHALMQAVPSPKQLAQMRLTLKAGMALEPEKLIVWLTEHGFNRLDQVEVPGDFAVRGGIIDIYLPGEFDVAADQVGLTVRLDFFGDEIESIRRFSLDTLGSLDPLAEITVCDIKGSLPDHADSTCFINYMPENGDGGSIIERQRVMTGMHGRVAGGIAKGAPTGRCGHRLQHGGPRASERNRPAVPPVIPEARGCPTATPLPSSRRPRLAVATANDAIAVATCKAAPRQCPQPQT